MKEIAKLAWLHVVLIYWRVRLHHARGYRYGMEEVHRRDVFAAQADLDHCETMRARAQMAFVEARADKRIPAPETR